MADLLVDGVVQAQRRRDRVALVLGQRGRGEEAAALASEAVRDGELDEVAREHGVDLVAQGGPLAHQPLAVGKAAAQRAGLLVWHPDLGQEVSGAELGEHLRVDLVGLDLGLRDRLGLHRVRDRHPPGVLRQDVEDGPGHRRRLEHDVVRGAERARKGRQVLRLHPAQAPDPAVLVDGHLGEALVNVEGERSHPSSSPH